MAEDFEAATASLGGGHGGLASGSRSGLGRRLGNYDERLQEMKKHIREVQDTFKRNEHRRKQREQEKRVLWIEYKADARRKRDEEQEQRRLRGQKSRSEEANHRRGHQNLEGAVAGNNKPHVAVGGLGSERMSTDLAPLPDSAVALKPGAPRVENGSMAHPDPNSAVHSDTLPRDMQSAGEQEAARLGERGPQPSGEKRKTQGRLALPDNATLASNATEVSTAATPAAQSTDASEVKKNLPASSRLRKKRKDEAAKKKEEKTGIFAHNIVQKAQEQFQGLYRSPEGRAIFDNATRRQKMHREALVNCDAAAVEACSLEMEDDAGEVQQEAETEQQPRVSNKHMAARYRLRMMHQITAQVLQCRRKMALNFQESFGLPGRLGCSPNCGPMVEGSIPAAPVQAEWIKSEAVC